MKRRAIMAALVAAMSLPASATEQPRQDSQQANSQQAYVPRLGDIMIAAQLRHFKLWYAGRVRNWPLASYELGLIRTAADDAARLYPNMPGADMTTMKQPVDDIARAIEAKDSAKFAQAFERLTAACNGCHKTTGFAFIELREPRVSPIETSPFSNESFSLR